MTESAKKSPLPRSAYIPAALSRYCLNGDAYVYAADVYHICCGDKPTISYNAFCVDLAEQVRLGGSNQRRKPDLSFPHLSIRNRGGGAPLQNIAEQ